MLEKMKYTEWYNHALTSLTGLFGEREGRSMLRILIEDLPVEEKAFDTPDMNKAQQALDRLLKGEPVQYVCGQAYFYDSVFKVDPAVLIPRPETEELVDLIIKRFESSPPLRILDIGTGSGCIAVTILKHLPQADITAIDVSKAALAVARDNATLHEVDVQMRIIDFLDDKQWHALTGPWDVIVSNPPYIPQGERHKVGNSSLDHEPDAALFTSDGDGLEFYRAIATYGQHWLTPNGEIVVEINEFRAVDTKACFENRGFTVEIIKDLSGKDRILRCTKS